MRLGFWMIETDVDPLCESLPPSLLHSHILTVKILDFCDDVTSFISFFCHYLWLVPNTFDSRLLADALCLMRKHKGVGFLILNSRRRTRSDIRLESRPSNQVYVFYSLIQVRSLIGWCLYCSMPSINYYMNN